MRVSSPIIEKPRPPRRAFRYYANPQRRQGLSHPGPCTRGFIGLRMYGWPVAVQCSTISFSNSSWRPVRLSVLIF
jgi:hypothetical protein